MRAYEALTAACRERLLADLSGAPSSEILIPHFERGKMLRSRLVFAAAGALSDRFSDVMAAAMAVELLHGASLIHDDIADGATTRRGLAAVHLRVPTGAAVVLADYLLLRAFTTLGCAWPTHPETSVLRAMTVLSQHAEDCCRGQLQDLEPASHAYGEEEYFELVRRKTGFPFAAAAQLGPILLGARAEEVEALATFGLEIGIAFQIQDDMLDVLGEAHSLGKPVGNSLAQGRPTLPLIYLRSRGSEAAQAKLRELQRLDESAAEVGWLLEEEGILRLARAAHKTHADRAVEALERLRPSEAVATLAALGRFIAGWAPGVAEPRLVSPGGGAT